MPSDGTSGLIESYLLKRYSRGVRSSQGESAHVPDGRQLNTVSSSSQGVSQVRKGLNPTYVCIWNTWDTAIVPRGNRAVLLSIGFGEHTFWRRRVLCDGRAKSDVAAYTFCWKAEKVPTLIIRTQKLQELKSIVRQNMYRKIL